MSLGGIHQYQANTASNTQTMGSVKETIGARPPAQVQELAPGKVFEGMVTEVKNGQVTLGLSDGRTISARMEAGVTLEQGQPMLFEVKANTGDQISIRPVTLESAQNPTLLKALEAAGLKVNPRNLSMVNQMMMEQMPIDKSSLMQMARAVAAFPQADMQALVQMQKLGFVINENSLNQFQNYQNGQQAILPQMQELMEGMETADAVEAALAALRTIYQDLPEYEQELEWAIRPDQPWEGTGTGYVVDCLRSAFMILLQASGYEDGVKRAVLLGNDTDTTACVAGGLLGIRYGVQGIPNRWMSMLREREKAEALLKRCLEEA